MHAKISIIQIKKKRKRKKIWALIHVSYDAKYENTQFYGEKKQKHIHEDNQKQKSYS